MVRPSALLAFAAALLASACQDRNSDSRFPKAHRPVAPIVGDSFSTEDVRDRFGEAEQVIAFAGVKPGMWVADIGAGEGYYTVRLAPAVGAKGRVLAEDIVPEVRERLALRVQREKIDNVAVSLGLPDDPRLPKGSLDRIFMVHMYHEVTEPYAFLWHLRDGLKADGLAVVVDADRPTGRHGTPPRLLDCEFDSVGFDLVKRQPIEGSDSYMALYRAVRPRPEPGKIRACIGG